MARAAGACLLCAGVLLAAPAAAQDDAPGPPGPYVLDVRGVVSSLASDSGLSGALPSGTGPPTRGLGVEVGVHVYPLGLGPARIGLGASLFRVAGKRAPVAAAAATSSTSAVSALPGFSTTFSALVPQFSLNFGSADGWSYVSAGIGRASIRSEILAAPGPVTADESEDEDASTVTASVKGSGALNALNMGGGARWFTKRRLAVSFDIRFHRLPPGSLGNVAATTLVVAGAGVSFR